MKMQRVLIGLMVINMVVLALTLAGTRTGMARDVAPVLRGRALEIVDGNGRVRATLSVIPADPTFKMPDGSVGSPEVVLLRLISAKGRPNVKVESTNQGGGIYLGGEDDPTSVLLGAKGQSSSINVTNKDGRRQEIKP